MSQKQNMEPPYITLGLSKALGTGCVEVAILKSKPTVAPLATQRGTHPAELRLNVNMRQDENEPEIHMKTLQSIKGNTVTILTMLGLIGSLTGCTTSSGRPDYTANGALIGGASGAAIGAIADRRAPGAGALIGGAAGIIAGGLVGHSMDQQAEASAQVAPPVPYVPPPPPEAAAPPPPPPEPVLVAPGPGYVWVDGEWVWQNGTWVWAGGHWVLPPQPHAVWIAPRWERGPHEWHRREGYWR